MQLEKGKSIEFAGGRECRRNQPMVKVTNVDDDKIEFRWTSPYGEDGRSYGYLVMSTGERMNVPQSFIVALSNL